ncbi:MAG TPA: hypothetical protein VK756_11270 [Solirubrobacteraceae bacterium]|nr:hypothetical protein [Solirubrobacteraceae bacterium]
MSETEHRFTARRTTPGALGASRGRRRARRGRGGLAALVFLLALGVLLPAGALALPEGRVYEMVSPVFKGGFGVTNMQGAAENGESVAFASPGAFAGSPASEPSNDAASQANYLARRGALGWSTVPEAAPAALAPFVFSHDISPTLESTLSETYDGSSYENAGRDGTAVEVFLHATSLPDTLSSWERVGEPIETIDKEPSPDLTYRSADPNFCHLLLTSGASQAYLAAGAQLYELDRGCGGAPASFRLVGVNDQGHSISAGCGNASNGVSLGDEEVGNEFNAVSADGEEVFFTDCFGLVSQLFVRLGGSRTLEVSKPLGEGDGCAEVSLCAGAAGRAGAVFVGAARDGSRVFFTTSAPLVGEDHDSGNDLYMASIGCPAGEVGCAVAGRVVRSLVQVSHDPSGGEAGVQGVVRVAPDGSRVYFVATGDLLTAGEQQALEGAGRAVPETGADNLYVYNSLADGGAGEIAFVGDLCSGYQLSGNVEDIHCPSTSGADAALWTPGIPETEAQTAGAEGQFLVFSSYAQLTASDTDSAKDVYRYDAQTGQLDRVSLGEGGYDANGNSGDFDAEIPLGYFGGLVKHQYELANRAVSEDGSRIVFSTSAPLSPLVSNGLENVYEWHEVPGGEGSVSLVSSGSATEPIEPSFFTISSSGRDIFFVTSQGLVPQDTDSENDIYDARLGGGFPAAPAAQRPCSGDACQGPLTNPQPLLVPGSVSQAPGENLPATVPVVTPKRVTVKCAKNKRSSHGKCLERKARRKAKRAGRSSNHRRAGR